MKLIIPKENINCKTDCIRDENLNRSVAIKKKKGKVTKELPTIVAAGLDCLLWGILPKL